MSSVLTVSQLNRYLSFKIKSDLKLKSIAVKGELSNFSINSKTGHAFFTVKDEESAISCIMFAGTVAKMRVVPENGMSVLVMGSVTVYERSGSCQIVATEIAPLGGVGAVHQKTEEVKERLLKAGVFDESRKKRIPMAPRKIAVVTSENAAALQDILNIIGRRFPVCTVEVYPARMQGELAPASIEKALSRADKSGAETIILARGGGSAEDLAPFDNEITVMAVYNCVTPIISAVGHQTDTTLCDYAADLRAPTPSAAAELSVPDMDDILAALKGYRTRLTNLMDDAVSQSDRELAAAVSRLRAASPEIRLRADEERLGNLSVRLRNAIGNRIKLNELELVKLHSQLQALSPFGVLERGYSIVEHGGRAVTRAEELAKGDSVLLRMNGGAAEALITAVIPQQEKDNNDF